MSRDVDPLTCWLDCGSSSLFCLSLSLSLMDPAHACSWMLRLFTALATHPVSLVVPRAVGLGIELERDHVKKRGASLGGTHDNFLRSELLEHCYATWLPSSLQLTLCQGIGLGS